MKISHNLKFSEKEFLDTIKSAKSHSEAARLLGYKNTRLSKNGTHRYGKLFHKLNPNTDHFCMLSVGHIVDNHSLSHELKLFYNIYIKNKQIDHFINLI